MNNITPARKAENNIATTRKDESNSTPKKDENNIASTKMAENNIVSTGKDENNSAPTERTKNKLVCKQKAEDRGNRIEGDNIERRTSEDAVSVYFLLRCTDIKNSSAGSCVIIESLNKLCGL